MFLSTHDLYPPFFPPALVEFHVPLFSRFAENFGVDGPLLSVSFLENDDIDNDFKRETERGDINGAGFRSSS